jgi:uncharacterized protein YjbI with pentapeptide repeats
MEIFDRAGNLVATSEPPDKRWFEKMVIRDAFLAGMEIEGISFEDATLENGDFTNADLYGANLYGATFESCSFVNGDLGGVCCSKPVFTTAKCEAPVLA